MTPTSATTQPGTRRRVREALVRARALWRDMTGESAYDRYLERYAREHAGCPNRPDDAHGSGHESAHEQGHEPAHGPMSEREFWRTRARQAETEISTGCC
ncbi:YbdD/YjiX family protein [uncultured Actinomyces sp.]|uniref:YbdD/YjiX family protein n=1 Tax=uncultured Actinomyces sp. TaxID=249061 RepID=UPI0025D2C76B|nr:YbdD/YjiX family protein [uncultured Actinomyces sp.]